MNLKLKIVGFDDLGSTGFYPESAVRTIDETVIPIGSIGLDTHQVMTNGGNISYKNVVYKTTSAPYILVSSEAEKLDGDGAYVDIEIFPDHLDLIPKLDVVSTSMYLAVEWEEDFKQIGDRWTWVAKRFLPDVFNSAGDIVAYGGTSGKVVALESACQTACKAIETDSNNGRLVQIVPKIISDHTVETEKDNDDMSEELNNLRNQLDAVTKDKNDLEKKVDDLTLQIKTFKASETINELVGKVPFKKGHEYAADLLKMQLQTAVEFDQSGNVQSALLAAKLAELTKDATYIDDGSDHSVESKLPLDGFGHGRANDVDAIDAMFQAFGLGGD